MKVRDLLYETGTAITANRARSLLTVLGIVIGIAAVITMTSLIDGIKVALVDQLGLTQSRMVNMYIMPKKGHLTLKEIRSFESDLSSDYEFITPAANIGASASSSTSTIDGMNVTACEPNYFRAMGTKLAAGRFFLDSENEGHQRVVVIDKNTARKLFGEGDFNDYLGKSIGINKDQYRVVGIVEDEAAFGINMTRVYVPLETAHSRLFGSSEPFYDIVGFAREDADMSTIADRTASYLKRRIGTADEKADSTSATDDRATNTESSESENSGMEMGQMPEVMVTTMDQILKQLDSLVAAFQMIAVSVASISLLVGGIGIMNMMLTNVTERIREIGLRKALGARPADITSQFLLESIALCLAGGVLGTLVGLAGASALSGLVASAMQMPGLTPVITPQAVLLATGICVSIGTLFGWYPARRAAKLDPIESLRYQ